MAAKRKSRFPKGGIAAGRSMGVTGRLSRARRQPAARPIAPRPGAAAAPAPAPAAAAVAPPLNPQFGADVDAAQLNLNTVMQQNQAARGQLGSTFGFGVDSAGNTIDDHSNPFSRAAALQTSYNQSKRGSTNSYAARGQLYSGALQNAQNENATQNLRGRDALISEFMGRRTSLQNSDVAAQNAYANAIANAQAQQALYALENPPDPDTIAEPQAPQAPQARVSRKRVSSKAPVYRWGPSWARGQRG